MKRFILCGVVAVAALLASGPSAMAGTETESARLSLGADRLAALIGLIGVGVAAYRFYRFAQAIEENSGIGNRMRRP